MPSKGIPSDAYLEAVQRSVEANDAARNAHILDIRAERRNTASTVVPKPYAEVATIFDPPYVRQVIARTQSLISADHPKLHRTPLKPEVPRSREDAELITAWFNEGAYPRMAEVEDTWAMVTDSIAEGGHGVWRLLARKHLWGRETQPKDDEDNEAYLERTDTVRKKLWPFAQQHVPTTNFHEVAHDEDGLSEVMEISTHAKAVLYSQYERELVRAGRMIEQDVSALEGDCELAQYWNRNSFVYRLDGTRVKNGHHGGRHPPYYHSLFSQTGVKDSAFESEAISDGILSAQAWVREMVTEKGVWAKLTCYPIFVLEPISDESLPQVNKKWVIEWAAGETTEPPPGYRWKPVQFPGTGQDLDQMISLMLQLIDQVSLAPILFGKSQGDQSGTVMHGLVQLARAIFGPCIRSITRQYDLMASEMLYLVEHEFKAPVPVEQIGKHKWLEIGAKEIQSYYRCGHTLTPLIAMEQMVEYQMAADQQQRGYVDKAYVRERIPGITKPQEMADRVLAEMVEGSQVVQQLVIAKVLELQKAKRQPPAPTMEEVTGVPMAAGPPEANVPAGLSGAGTTQGPLQQGIAPGMGGGGAALIPPEPMAGVGRG